MSDYGDGAGGFDRTNYASPNLRWALCLEDHPYAKRTFEERKGTELVGEMGEPFARRYGDIAFILCAVYLDDDRTYYGVKEIPTKLRKKGGGTYDWPNTPEEYAKIQTKACGRALRAAGYPSDVRDLRAVLAWRARMVQIEGTVGGDDDGDDDEMSDMSSSADHLAEATRATAPPAQSSSAPASSKPADRTSQPFNDPAKIDPVASFLDTLVVNDETREMWRGMTDEGRSIVTEWVRNGQGQGKGQRVIEAFIKHTFKTHQAAGDNAGPVGEADSNRPTSSERNAEPGPAAPALPPELTDHPVEAGADNEPDVEGGNELRAKLRALHAFSPDKYTEVRDRLLAEGIDFNGDPEVHLLVMAEEIMQEMMFEGVGEG